MEGNATVMMSSRECNSGCRRQRVPKVGHSQPRERGGHNRRVATGKRLRQFTMFRPMAPSSRQPRKDIERTGSVCCVAAGWPCDIRKRYEVTDDGFGFEKTRLRRTAARQGRGENTLTPAAHPSPAWCLHLPRLSVSSQRQEDEVDAPNGRLMHRYHIRKAIF
jgi:hypothetical protein